MLAPGAKARDVTTTGVFDLADGLAYFVLGSFFGAIVSHRGRLVLPRSEDAGRLLLDALGPTITREDMFPVEFPQTILAPGGAPLWCFPSFLRRMCWAAVSPSRVLQSILSKTR